MWLQPAAAHAQVSPSEWLFHGGLGLAGEPDFTGNARGMAVQGGVVRGLPGAFTLGLEVETLRLFASVADESEEDEETPRRAWGSHGLYLPFGANVDILAIIPWINLAPGVTFGAQDPDAAPSPVLRLGLGFDYRPRRTWSSGAAVYWTTAGPDWKSLPDRALVVLRFGWIVSPSAL